MVDYSKFYREDETSQRHLTDEGYQEARNLIGEYKRSQNPETRNKLAEFSMIFISRIREHEIALARQEFIDARRVVDKFREQELQVEMADIAQEVLAHVLNNVKPDGSINDWSDFSQRIASGIKTERKALVKRMLENEVETGAAREQSVEMELPNDSPLQDLLRDKINQTLKKLTYREREIIKMRNGLGDGHQHSIEDVGRTFKITRERVRQIEDKAMRKLTEHGVFGLSKTEAPQEMPATKATQQIEHVGIDRILKMLTYRQREVIKLRYGLNQEGVSHSVEAVADTFQTQPKHLGQIEKHALVRINLLRQDKEIDGLPDSLREALHKAAGTDTGRGGR